MMQKNTITPHPHEVHKSQRAGWLRAAVLGVNDGVVSTASLMLGVSSASTNKSTVLTAGIAGLVAGALSMAVGEYVSVSSQRDSERADIDIERRSLAANPDAELAELAQIYEKRGLEPKLALTVAQKLHDHDAVAAHARDELGIDGGSLANPVQAALTSAIAFSIGAIVPILATIISSNKHTSWRIVIASLILLAISGAVGAILGGGHRVRAAARVLIGGAVAMAVTAFIGHLIGKSI
jgi:VIT1/CCC1 family predicted Fe2+/Mn2+ transporter